MRTVTNNINENRTGRTTTSDITIQESRGMERKGGEGSEWEEDGRREEGEKESERIMK